MASANEDDVDKSRDYGHICPLAECLEVGGRVALRAPVIGVCAEVEHNEPFRGWLYSVSCKRYGRHVRGRKEDRAAAVSEMLFWLGSFGCPGRLGGPTRFDT